MRRGLALLLAFSLTLVFAAPVLAKGGTGITATPAQYLNFAGTYWATFVRSASGIINETDRINTAGAQNGWVDADVWLQFRPLTGPDGTGDPIPNPDCDPNGLVTAPFVYHNNQPSLAGTPTEGYFIGTNPYRVCVYLVNPVVASGTIDSALQAGTTATLPDGLDGRFRIDVGGTWLNESHGYVDAQYNNGDNLVNDFTFYQQGWPGIGDGWGRLLVGDVFVDWGAFDAGHDYTYELSTSVSIKLNVFDGYSAGPTYVPGWYGDNDGSLSYTITYLGL